MILRHRTRNTSVSTGRKIWWRYFILYQRTAMLFHRSRPSTAVQPRAENRDRGKLDGQQVRWREVRGKSVPWWWCEDFSSSPNNWMIWRWVVCRKTGREDGMNYYSCIWFERGLKMRKATGCNAESVKCRVRLKRRKSALRSKTVQWKMQWKSKRVKRWKWAERRSESDGNSFSNYYTMTNTHCAP